MKVMNERVDPNDDSYLKEAQILKALNHPTIIRYEDDFLDADKYKQKHFCLVMEYADCKYQQINFVLEGTLRDDIKPFIPQEYDEPKILRILVVISMGVFFLHSQGIIHRDIKPDNFFKFGNNIYKLGDFGLSRKFNLVSQVRTNSGSGT